MFPEACTRERHPDQRGEVAQQLLPPRCKCRLRDAKIVDVRRAAYSEEAVRQLADAY
jgi:DNA-binding TFAR19-related protein (PDSD5 family)